MVIHNEIRIGLFSEGLFYNSNLQQIIQLNYGNVCKCCVTAGSHACLMVGVK